MKILHTMLRVSDLSRSIAFYQDVLGMALLKKKDYASGKFTLAFLGYPNQKDGAEIELTFNWGDHQYTRGDAFGHIAVAVEDLYEACERASSFGCAVTREPGPMKHGGRDLAFIADPDGNAIELLSDS